MLEEYEEEYDSPLHYVDHKEQGPITAEEDAEDNEILESYDEDHPTIEKGEHHIEEEQDFDNESGDDFDVDEEHYIPEKGEHHFEEEDEYVDAEHLIPHKGEHHESDVH